MKQALLLFLLLAAATAHGQLFDLLDYREGVATLQINARLTNIYMYEPRGEIDTIVHEFPASAVAFVYEGKEYHNVGLNDSLELVDIDYRDSVKMTITVWRDRKDLMGRSPYAEVTAIERLRASVMYATGMVSTLKYMASTATCAIATTGRKSREKSIGISTGSIISSATNIGDNNNKETSYYSLNTTKDSGHYELETITIKSSDLQDNGKEYL